MLNHEILVTHDGYYVLKEWEGDEANPDTGTMRAKTLMRGTTPEQLTAEATAFFTHLYRPTIGQRLRRIFRGEPILPGQAKGRALKTRQASQPEQE